MTAPDLTDDAFLGGALSILQLAQGYRAGLDAVLLAAAAPVVPLTGACVLDAGAGVGVVGLAIAARVADARLTLVEIDPRIADLARRNAERNGLAGRVQVVVADIGAGGALLHGAGRPAGLAPASFDHIVTNPPYYASGSGTPSALPSKATAHQMASGGLDQWLAFLATVAKSDATLTLIHRADALAQVLAAIGSRFGRLRVLPIHPRAGVSASRIIVAGVKGSRAPLELKPGLILQEADGRYRPEVEAILRHGAPLAV